MGDASEFTAITITNIDVVDIIAIAGGAAAFNGSLFSGVGKIDIGVDNANNAFTLVSGSTAEYRGSDGLDFDLVPLAAVIQQL